MCALFCVAVELNTISRFISWFISSKMGNSPHNPILTIYVCLIDWNHSCMLRVKNFRGICWSRFQTQCYAAAGTHQAGDETNLKWRYVSILKSKRGWENFIADVYFYYPYLHTEEVCLVVLIWRLCTVYSSFNRYFFSRVKVSSGRYVLSSNQRDKTVSVTNDMHGHASSCRVGGSKLHILISLSSVNTLTASVLCTCKGRDGYSMEVWNIALSIFCLHFICSVQYTIFFNT